MCKIDLILFSEKNGTDCNSQNYDENKNTLSLLDRSIQKAV